MRYPLEICAACENSFTNKFAPNLDSNPCTSNMKLDGHGTSMALWNQSIPRETNNKSPNLTPKKFDHIIAWTLHPNKIVDIITFALTPLACTPCYLSYYILLYLVSILKHNCKVQLAFSIDKRDCILDSSAIVGSFLTTAAVLLRTYYSILGQVTYIWEEYLFM